MIIRTIAMVSILTMLGGLPAEAQPLDKAERVCASAKLKATAKKVGAKLKCEAKAIVKELPSADAACLSKAEEKFSQTFLKAEEKGGCVSELDAVAVEAEVDAFVAGEVTRQKSGTGTLPGCPTLGAVCGSCGSGVCVPHVPGGALVCVNTLTGTGSGCASDAMCVSPQICVSAGGPTACVSTCP